ncbi:RNA polymerase sigma factor [Luteolibacter soli]|uniref:Sigma-70 family RNA polymerase sigma factor n=1 Tax=Luteolibacter soli TaxID=3135280 RepID=A0ABU9AXD6_9BACT
MMADETKRLLGEFARERSERAFRELVRLHSPVVYGTALRMLGGDRAAAQDVMQEVFTLLARKAGSLGDVILSAWLYRQTCRRAANHARTESRRRQRELVAASMMDPSQTETSFASEALSGEVDAAMLSLPSPARDALVLRFFEGHDFRKLGSALGTTEEAARKRVTRALDQLAATLRKRGIAVGSASLGTTMASFGTTPVPASLVTQVATHAFQSAPLTGASWKADWLIPVISGVLATSLIAGTALAIRDQASPPPASPSLATKAVPRPASQPTNNEDLIAEIKRIQAGPKHSLTTLKLRATLERISITELPAFFSLAHDKLTTAEQAVCFNLLLERWVQSDPDAALTFMIEHPLWDDVDKARGTNLINNIFDRWMYADLSASRAWLVDHWQAAALRKEAFDSTLGEFLAMSIADEVLLHESANAAFSFIASLPDEAMRRRALIALTGANPYMNAWHNIDPTRLNEMLRETQKLNDRAFGCSIAAIIWQKTLEDQPEKAAQLESMMTPADHFARELGELGVRHRHTHNTPMAGGGYTSHSEPVEPLALNERQLIESGIAAGLSRGEVLNAVATALLDQRDLKRAFAWIDDHQTETSFDDLLHERLGKYAGPVTGWVVGDTPYARIIELASRLSDQESAREICRGAFRRLQCQIPGDVPGILERKDLPAAIREELQQLAKTTP